MITFGNIKKEHLGFFKVWRNKQVDFFRQTKILTDKDQSEWFKKMKKDKAQKLFAIFENKKLAGYCGLVYIDPRHRRAEVSFLTSPEITENKAAYKKYFLMVLKMLSDCGFKKLKLNKLYTDTFEFRRGHIKILEEFGFKKEATLKKHYFKRGKYCDSIIHSMFSNG